MRKQDSISHSYPLRYTAIKYKLKCFEFVI